jgi:Protein of unknown function (DUF3515)
VGAVVLSCLALAGCGGPVRIDAPTLSGADADACARLLPALPDRVADLERVESEAGKGYAAAWGDPPIELRCGVGRPKGFSKVAACQRVNGVDWFIPESQVTGQKREIVMTTVGRAQNVEVRIPDDYFPPAATMADLAPAVRTTIREVRPCV